MVGKDLRRKGYGFLRGDHPVGPHIQRQLVVIDALAHAGAFDVEIYLEHRCVNRIDRNFADHAFRHALFIALVRDVTPSLIQGQLHIELCPVAQGGDVQLRIKDLHLAVSLDRRCSDLTGALRGDLNGFCLVAVQLRHKALDVENDLGHVFLYAWDGGKFVQHAVDLYRFDSHARQAGKQNPAKAVSQGSAEASFQRLHHELAIGAVIGNFLYCNFGSFYLNHPRSSLAYLMQFTLAQSLPNCLSRLIKWQGITWSTTRRSGSRLLPDQCPRGQALRRSSPVHWRHPHPATWERDGKNCSRSQP